MGQLQTDKQLMACIQAGDARAFEELYNRYWEPLFTAALHRLQSRQIAKDVIQELFIYLWERRESLAIRSSVQGYLYTALKHRIINKIKSEMVRDEYEKMTTRFYEINCLATEHQFSEHALTEELNRQTERLPDRCRQVFRLSRIEHMSHKEIGKKLNISPKTVENHIGLALKVLRPRLERILYVLVTFSVLVGN